MQKGGIVPGSGTGDKVPALLEPGELVVPRNQVARQKFNQINQPAEAGEVKPTKTKRIRNTLDGDKTTQFTHLDLGTRPLNQEDPAVSNYIKGYSNFGIDLPKKWNQDWALKENFLGVYSGNFKQYIRNNDVFKTYKGKGKKDNLKLYQIDQNIQNKFNEKNFSEEAKKILINSIGDDKFYDIDPEVEMDMLPAIFKIKEMANGALDGLRRDVARKEGVEGKNGQYYERRVKNELGDNTLTQPITIESWRKSARSVASYNPEVTTSYVDSRLRPTETDKLLYQATRRNYHALGGPISRQRFMEGDEVTHRKAFLDNSFNPGMKLKSALQDTPRIIFKRQPKEYEKFPNMDHTSPHFEQFSEMFVGSRKASQFKRAVEYQRLYQEALKNNDVESANKYDKLNKLPANMRLLAAAKALPSAQEKARTNSFEDGNFDYEKNLLVNYSGKKTTTRHELGAHAAAYGASKEGSPLANSLFGSIGRRMGAYGKGSGETTLISEMQAHTIQSAKQKDKIKSLKEFISSEKMAKLYKSEAHETLADSMQKGSEIPIAGVLGGRHKGIEIDVLKRMMQDAYGDNPEVLSEKMSLLNPSDSSNKVNFGALFADSKQSKRYAVGGSIYRQRFADGDKATAKSQGLEEFYKGLNSKELAQFEEKIRSAKQIIINARTSGSMKLKSVGFNFLGKKFNLADKLKTKTKNEKPIYDLKGVKSLDELLSKIPPNYSEELRAKIGRAQDKFLGTKNIKDLKFAYDFGDKRGPLNIQLEKDVIKFGTIATFPWKPKTRKEKRTEELRIATERNARKKAQNIDKARQKSETASELNALISSIDEENQQSKFYGIARDTKVFEGSDQYKELQKKLALDRQQRERKVLPTSKEGMEDAIRQLNESQFAQPQKLIGINENYKAIQPISGTSPQAQRLRMQMEEREFQGPIIGIAKDQKTKKGPRVKKTEGEKYNIARKQSAPAQEKTLFDEMELAKIGTYQTQEERMQEDADKIKRFRDAAAESRIQGRFRLNERKSNRVRARAIANENLADNLMSLRSKGSGKPIVSQAQAPIAAQATNSNSAVESVILKALAGKQSEFWKTLREKVGDNDSINKALASLKDQGKIVGDPNKIGFYLLAEKNKAAKTRKTKPVVSEPITTTSTRAPSPQIPEDYYNPYGKPKKPRAKKNTASSAQQSNFYNAQESEYQKLLDSINAQSRSKKRRGFASGGLVPGTGNSDTVPMDLPEGSFVIRKSSVNKIGADNLAKATRFANGGTVPALLTPGEYVYSPEEASKIGSSKLHAMNKFAKFARGGPIGLGRSGKFDPNNPDDIKKLKETLEEQLRYEDPNKDESLVQIEVKQNTDEIQNRARQYTADENARQQAETTLNSRNALVTRQRAKVNASQQNINAARSNVQSATTARDSYIDEANTQRQLVLSNRQEATRQQARITSLTSRGVSATDPRLVAANAALIAATTGEANARNLQARATRNAISANNQVIANTNTLNGLLVTHQQQVNHLTRAENAAATALQGLEAATLKAEGSAQLLDEYQQDAAGKVLLAGKVIGETKPLSGRGSLDNALKRKEKDYEKQTDRKVGKDEREILKGDLLSEYRASAEKQLRAKSVQSGKPISELNLQATADLYTREFSEGKRRANYNKQGEIIGDRSLAGDLTGNARRGKTNTDYTAEGDLTTTGKIKDFAFRSIIGAKRTDFAAGSEGDQQFKESRGRTVANRFTFAAIGASFASEKIKASGGTVAGIVSKGEGDTVKVDENAASGFKSVQAFSASLSSATTYAATAAQSLAEFGPGVALAGAGLAGIVGAIEGYHNGIKQAEAEIREAKIAQALNNLQNIFERVSNGLLEVNDSTLRKISENQKIVETENIKKAYEEAGGNASPIMKGLSAISGGLLGNDINSKKFNELKQKSEKETAAAQIVPLTNVLNKYSEQIGKDAALKIKSGGGDISTTNFEDIKGRLLKDLRSSGGGAGAEQISKLAAAQDISIADAEKQFIKTLQESFQAEKIKSVTTKAVQENARAINSMQSLSNAVNAAAASADSFSSKLDTNSSLFEGSIGSTKLTSFAERSGGSTPDFAKFNTAITESSGLLGAYGQEFKSQGNAVNAASQILPDILAQSVANPISGKETATQITDALKEGLKARGITGAAADQVVSSIGGKVSSEDFTKLLAEAGGDVSKATQKLLSDIRDPLISAFTEIDNKLTEAGNKYISGLEDLAKRQKAIGDQIGRLSELRSRSRSFAANEIQRLPGVQQGVAESINLQGARNDFSEQQQRLTGFGAGAAENPAAIASRLKNTQQQIRVQEEKVLNTNKSTNGGAEFRNAALELTKLKSQASNLNDALKNLTDQSKKLEAAQAKLAQVRQNIEEKRSLGRKLLTQSPEEQQKMLQGQAIFNQVQARGGNLQGMSTEENAILFDFLDNFGAAGKKIQDQILDANGYGAGKDDKAEEKALVAEQARIFAQQEEAQRQIIANQQSLQQDYFSNLDSRNEKFYSELQKFIQEMQKNTLIAEKGKEQQKAVQIKDVQKEGKFLGESGFNTKEDFQKLSTYKGQVESLVKNKQETTRIDELAAKAIGTNGDIPIEQDFLTGRNRKISSEGVMKFEQNLTQNGYKASEAQRIREIAQQKLDEGANKDEVQILARKQFHEEKSFGLKQEKEQVATVFKGSGIEGKLNNLVEKLASGTEISLDQFNRALASVKELQLGVGEGLSTAAIGAEARIKALNEAINSLAGIQQIPNAEVKPQVSAFAIGGSVFKSRGTDTVPAMLTPGEFVVNKSATQQNLPLLQSINSGKTSYLAEGGIAGYINNASSNLFMNSDEYNEAVKNQKKLNVGSFSKQIIDIANKVNQAKLNKDYFKNQSNFYSSDRDILNKEFSKGRTPYYVEKSVFENNFLTKSSDWLSKLNPSTELGFDESKIERISYFKKLYDEDYNSNKNGIDSWGEIKDFLKKQTVSDSTLFRNIQQIGTGGFANSYLTTGRFNEALPKTNLYKKYNDVYTNDENYLDKTIAKINESEQQPIKNKTILEQARKAFETRRLKEIEDLKKQEDQKNAEKKKNEITKKLDTSKETGSIENSPYLLGAIAKTKDIEEQKKKLKESGIQDAYVNTGKIFEDVGQSNVDQFIKEKGAKQDNYFLRRKGSAESIAKIYLQREAQAQSIIGKLELMQSPEYSDDPSSIDPKTAYAVGQQELQNLIDGKETKINKNSLEKISSGQKKIVSSFITMNSFEKAATSKGSEMVSYIDKYGKALNKDPKVLVDSLIKAKEKRSDISGDSDFITAQAQGIFEALMFLDREAKANNLFANRNQIKKGKGLLGVLEERSEKNIKSFIKFGKLKGNIDDKGLGIVDFGAKDPTEVDFNTTNFKTAIPPQSIEDIKKFPSSKNGINNNLLTDLGATASISNYGYLNFPTVKDDIVLGLEKDGGLFKVNSFPKQDEEGKTIFERQAKIALLENKNTYQQLVEISKQIKGTPSVDFKNPLANVELNPNQKIDNFDPNEDPAEQIRQIAKEKENAKAIEAKEAKTTRRDVRNLNKIENPRFNVGQRIPTRDEFQNDTVDLFKNFVELKNTLYRQKSKELIVGQDSDKIVNTDQGLYEGEKETQYGNGLLSSSFKYFTRNPNVDKLDYSIKEINANFPIEEPYVSKLNRYPELLAKIANFYKFGEQTEGSPEYVKSIAKLKNDAQIDNIAIIASIQNSKKMEDYYDSLIKQNNNLLEPPTIAEPIGFDPKKFATENSQIPLTNTRELPLDLGINRIEPTKEKIEAAKQEMDDAYASLMQDKLDNPNYRNDQLPAYDRSNIASSAYYDLVNPPMTLPNGGKEIVKPFLEKYGNFENYAKPEEGQIQKQERLNTKTAKQISDEEIMNRPFTIGLKQGDAILDFNKNGIRIQGNAEQEKQYDIVQNYLNSPTYRAIKVIQDKIDNIKLKQNLDIVKDMGIYPENAELSDTLYLRALDNALAGLKSQDVITESYKQYVEMFREQIGQKLLNSTQQLTSGTQFTLKPETLENKDEYLKGLPDGIYPAKPGSIGTLEASKNLEEMINAGKSSINKKSYSGPKNLDDAIMSVKTKQAKIGAFIVDNDPEAIKATESYFKRRSDYLDSPEHIKYLDDVKNGILPDLADPKLFEIKSYYEQQIDEILKKNKNYNDLQSEYNKLIKYRSSGGSINYLAGGGVPSYRPNPNPSFFKPKGTDTVPAMLSPGEFVINASATAKHGDLLSAINSGKDVSYSANGGLIEYLAYGDTVKSRGNRAKNLGVTPQSLMEADQSKDMQKLYEQFVALDDSIANEQSDRKVKLFEKILGRDFFEGADANKKPGTQVGDAGNYAEGPKGLGGYIQKTKTFQLPKYEEQKQEQERPKQRTRPLSPPPSEPEPEPKQNTTTSSYSDPAVIAQAAADREEARKNLFKNKQFITEKEIKNEIKKIKEDRAIVEEGMVMLQNIENLSRGGMPISSSDTIPAMLTPGEFVVNARESSKNASLLHAINTGKDIEGFANGGSVGYYAGGLTGGGSRPSSRFMEAATKFDSATTKFDSAISKINIPNASPTNNAQYIDIAKSSFDELSRILKTEIKVGSESIDKFYNAVTQFGTNSTSFNGSFSSSLEKFKTYTDELSAAISKMPGTLNLEIYGNLNASLNVNFDTASVYAAVTNATESLKGWITSEVNRQITDEMG